MSAPFARDEIGDALTKLHDESVEYWSSLPTDVFLAPIGEAWSPARNVRHLTKAMRPVTRGLHVPRMVLRMTFGKPSEMSRTFDAMRAVYLDALSAGGQAGPFTPSERAVTSSAEAERTRIMTEHALAVEELCAALAVWPEAALDEHQMPHPLLGKLTVREMLLFTLYHNEHHANTVKHRMSEQRTT